MYAKPEDVEEYLNNSPKNRIFYANSCMIWEIQWVDLALI